jgi:uncharacterized protein
MKIAIIGAGIAGLSAARLLYNKHEIMVFEAENYPGGHAHTLIVDTKEGPLALDTGFLVFNHPSYPNLRKLMQDLRIPTFKSDLSLAISLHNSHKNMEYSSVIPGGIFADLKNLICPKFWKLLFEITRFNRVASKDLLSGLSDEESIGEYLKRHHFEQNFLEQFLVPMASIIWSSPFRKILDFPVASILMFLNNHRLLSLKNRPQWYSVSGGSKVYIEKLIEPFKDRILLNRAGWKVIRHENSMEVIDRTHRSHHFDQVILACHADQTLALLQQPSDQEQTILSAFRYQKNTAYLHQDSSLMPRHKRAWASWNALVTQDKPLESMQPACITYWLNRIQNIPSTENFFVTLNPPSVPKNPLEKINYTHPTYDFASLEAQKHLDKIQGKDRVWFCGSYFGYGFHEDALNSGIDVAVSLGGEVHWRGFND